MESKIWFTADLHFGHKNICKYTGRSEAFGLDTENPDMEEHDRILIDIWNKAVSKYDTVYILGDLSFRSTEATRKILEKLNGKKVMILGNHDKSITGLENYFVSVCQIKTMVFKKSLYPFLDDNFAVCMCHYPLLSWERKAHGAVHLHGHCHGSIDSLNEKSGEFRLDVGFDGLLAGRGLVDLESIYNKFTEMAGGAPIREYLMRRYESGKTAQSDINLTNRYGSDIKLVHVSGNEWKLVIPNSVITMSRTLNDDGTIHAIDPEGGPFLSVGTIVGGRSIESISCDGNDYVFILNKVL